MSRFAILDISPFEGRSGGFVKDGPLCSAEERLFLDGNIPCQQSSDYRMMLLILIDDVFCQPPDKQNKIIRNHRKTLYNNMIAYRPYSFAKSPMPSSADFYADLDVLVKEINKGSWQSLARNDELIKELLEDKNTRVYRTKLPE